MRTIIDIPEEQVKALDRLGNRQKISRAEIVRRAISEYLNVRGKTQPAPIKNDIRELAKAYPDAWDGLDGLEYQLKIRSDWDERDRLYGNWGLQEPLQPPYAPPEKPEK